MTPLDWGLSANRPFPHELTHPARTVPDNCPDCGSDSLFSGYFDADDLAVDTDTGDGTRWTTWCQDCGTEVGA